MLGGVFINMLKRKVFHSALDHEFSFKSSHKNTLKITSYCP